MEPKEKYGTSAIEEIHLSLVSIANLMLDKFKDGVGITDITILFPLYKNINTISDNWEQAQLELADLDNNESANLIEKAVTSGMKTAGIDLNQVGNYGIDSLILAFNNLIEIIELVVIQLKDGFQFKDLSISGEVATKINEGYSIWDTVVLEATDINGREYASLSKLLLYRVHGLLR